MNLSDLVARVGALMAEHSAPPVMIGISGSPGAGKTTLALALVEALRLSGYSVAHLPMDGFHLADPELDRLGLRDRKGALETFDADGYVSLLRRARATSPFTIYAPSFERNLEQPLAGALPLAPGTQVVITEGNYLLCPDAPWSEIPFLLDQTWHCLLDDTIRRERLVRRHIQFGKSPSAAREWVDQVDEGNAHLIEKWQVRADVVVDLSGW